MSCTTCAAPIVKGQAYGLVVRLGQRRYPDHLCSDACVLATVARLELCGDTEHIVAINKTRYSVCRPVRLDQGRALDASLWDPWVCVPCACVRCAKPMGLPAYRTRSGRYYWPGSGFANASEPTIFTRKRPEIKGICSSVCACEDYLTMGRRWWRIGDGAWVEL